MNRPLALKIIQDLFIQGVDDFCVCPGARNSPLVALLAELPELTKYYFYDERSAAFFALGRGLASGKPVAVVTTSGTAAAELLPATMEAYYTCQPLVLITADRPQRFRGSGSPQTAEQVGLYGQYALGTWDIASEADWNTGVLGNWDQHKPLHLNICFEEPLLEPGPKPELKKRVTSIAEVKAHGIGAIGSAPGDFAARFLSSVKHPLAILGTLPPRDQPLKKAVLDFLVRNQIPTYIEAQSGLRESPELERLNVAVADGILSRAEKAGYVIDGVIRIGGIPTLRLWRDLEALGGKLPVLSVSDRPFSGLSWSKSVQPFSALGNSCAAQAPEDFLKGEKKIATSLLELLEKYSDSEPGWFHALSKKIPAQSLVYLGNSLPIREWDLAATRDDRGFVSLATRGLNGIDGQVSTFLGVSDPARDNWAVVGDLTALYDLGGPWILSQLPTSQNFHIVVINNGGGQIFSKMFPQREFINEHQIQFEPWAKLWGLSYQRWHSPKTSPAFSSRDIIEIQPNAESTKHFHSHYEKLWKSP